MTTAESAQLLESGLYCCCKCKGMFNCQDERLKHQISCIGNPFKTTCTYFACERKTFLQLFQPEDFPLDGCEQPFFFSKDDSFINHFVKIRVPDIFDPSIFLKTTAQANTVDTDDSNFLLESNINTLEEEAEKSTCSTFLESDKQVDSTEDDQIQKIINKNIEYLKNTDLPNLNTGSNKVPSFQSNQNVPRLLSPVDKHLHLFGDGSKSRVHSPFERSSSSSFLPDGQIGYNFMYSSNPSIPFSCNFSTDLFSSTPPPTQDDNQTFLTNIEECPTLKYLDLARKDPFFGQNPGMTQINTKDPFLINASVKIADRPTLTLQTPTLQKSHITRSCEDLQASPTLQLQDGNYFNFPSTLDEPTQLDYLDLATLDFITNPNLVPSAPNVYKEKSAEKDDEIFRVTDISCEGQMNCKPESNSKVLSKSCNSNSRDENAVTIKNKKLRLKKSKSDVERRQHNCELPSDHNFTGNLTVVNEDFPKENFDLIDDVVANCSGNERPHSETKDYRICRKRKLDSSKVNNFGETKPTKTHKRSGDTRRMSKTDIVLSPTEMLANNFDKHTDSMNSVLSETGCIYVKKKRSLSCDEPVVYVDETNVFGDAGSFHDSSKPRPTRIRTKSNSYITGLSTIANLETSPNKAQKLTSIIKLRCPNCTFSCQSAAELKSHCTVHGETNTSVSMNNITVPTLDKDSPSKVHDSRGSILSCKDLPVTNNEAKAPGSLLYSVKSSNTHFSNQFFSKNSSESSMKLESQADKATLKSSSSFRVIEQPRMKTDNMNKAQSFLTSFNIDNAVNDLDAETELAVRAIANVASNDTFELLDNNNDSLERIGTAMSTSSNSLYEFGKGSPSDLHGTNSEQINDDFGKTNISLDVAENCEHDHKPEYSQPVNEQESNQFGNVDINADLEVTSLSLFSLPEISDTEQSSSIKLDDSCKPAEPEFDDVKSPLEDTFLTCASSSKNKIDSIDRNLFETFQTSGKPDTESYESVVVSTSNNLYWRGDPDNNVFAGGMPAEETKNSGCKKEQMIEEVFETKKAAEIDDNEFFGDSERATDKSVLKEVGVAADSDKTVEIYDEMHINNEDVIPVSKDSSEFIETDKIIKEFINDMTECEKSVSDKNIHAEIPTTVKCNVALETKSENHQLIPTATRDNENMLTNEKGFSENKDLNSRACCEIGSPKISADLTIENKQHSETLGVDLLSKVPNTLTVHASKLIVEGTESKLKRVIKIIKLNTNKSSTTAVLKGSHSTVKSSDSASKSSENEISLKKPSSTAVVNTLCKIENCSENVCTSSVIDVPTNISTSTVMLKNLSNSDSCTIVDSKNTIVNTPANIPNTTATEQSTNNVSNISTSSNTSSTVEILTNNTTSQIKNKNPLPLPPTDDKQPPVKYYICEEKGCSFKSIYKKNLVSHHKQIHLCEQKYLCDQCAYCTPHLSCLKHHIQTKHLHEKRFKCPTCNYLSKFRLDVVKHVRHTHMKQKQFACNQCEYKTGHSHSLKLHLMAHAGVYSYKCSACDYRVGSTDKVTRHIKFKHVNQTGVKCEKLDVTFKVDAKQFLCDEKVPNDDIKVIELSAEEAKILTEQQMKEKELKSKLAIQEKKLKPKKSNDGFEMIHDEVNRIIVMKKIVTNSQKK